ncbi:MAG: TM0106 family RecB-like putative nuclease [Patescibacteria group bacterium]
MGYITATDIYKYFQCPHWPYYDRFATPEEAKLKRPLSEGEKRRLEDGVEHEQVVVESLYSQRDMTELAPSGDAEKDAAQTLQLMRLGVPIIYQGTLLWGNRTGRPDILEKREGASALGEWHYVPIDIKSTHELEKYQKYQLAFYSELLKHTQDKEPEEAAIINADKICLPFDPRGIKDDYAALMADIESLADGKKPLPVLRKACLEVGQWGVLCEADAVAKNDIARLYNVDVQKLKALRTLGVRNVADAADMSIASLVGAVKGLTEHALETIKIQAESLENDSIIVRRPVKLDYPGWEIHFDIESDPPTGLDYLYGILIKHDGVTEYKAFVAETLEQEHAMWSDFLDWIKTLPGDYAVYHYSSYELSRLKTLEQRYGGSIWLDYFRDKTVDLKELTKHSITYPLHFYGLKNIAKFLGFKWRGDIANGAVSIDRFEQFKATGDRSILEDIIKYNEDDVLATAYLKAWLDKYAGAPTIYLPPYPWAAASANKNPFA